MHDTSPTCRMTQPGSPERCAVPQSCRAHGPCSHADRSLPDIGGVEFSAVMAPAAEVGGDFYDCFSIDAHHLGIVIGDVSGKGLTAALFMSVSRALLKAHARQLRRPGPTLARLNDQLCGENRQLMFVTAFFAVLDVRSGKLTYANAGHVLPLRLGVDGRLVSLPAARGIALGAMARRPYEEAEVVLVPGDTLFLYTDGLTDAGNARRELFGEKRLHHALEAAGARQAMHPSSVDGLVTDVVNAVRAFEGTMPQADDMTCMAMRFHGLRETLLPEAGVAQVDAASATG